MIAEIRVFQQNRRNAARLGRTLGYQLEFTDLLKHASEITPWREAHGSISAQEGQPIAMQSPVGITSPIIQ